VLARDTFLRRYTYHAYRWNGEDDAGEIQRPGRYRMRVMLEDEDRTLTLPGTIRLEPEGAVPCEAGGHAKGGGGKGQTG
jgi:hypothetical protein